MNIVELNDLTKIYKTKFKKGDTVAVDGVSFTVGEGEIFGLLGPNGAGKTTMVRALLNIISITAGTALLRGLPPSDARSREKVGYLPENHQFPTHLTGLGLLHFAGRLHGMDLATIRERAAMLIEKVGMEKWGTTKIRKYSKGMTQRIGLAQALISDPDLIFLDEPTDGIDAYGKVEVRNILKDLRDQGKTIFLNSHLLSEVEAVADRVAILQRGKLVKVASVEALTNKASQYEIEADIGNKHIEIPESIGRRLSISAKRIIVALNDPLDVNRIIDELRLKRINILAVKPVKVTLEESFLETLAERPEEEATS